MASRAPHAEDGWVRLAVLAALLGAGGFFLLAIAWFLPGPYFDSAANSVELTGDPDADLPGLQERTIVRAADASTLAVLADEFDREVVELERVPEHVREAVLVAEDRRFYEHKGYDAAAMVRAALANLEAGGVVQGASTITQQLAQINFLGAEETISRKLEEISIAVALEREYSKDELLERYLNQVYFGAGTYGINAAAQQWFRVLPEDLTVEQGALLAGMIRSPSTLNPRENPQNARARRNDVLRGMARERYLPRRRAYELIELPIEVAPPIEGGSDQPYVVEAVKREFLSNETFGETVDERIDLLFGGGLVVHTTVIPALQEHADAVVSEAFPHAGGATAAIAAVQPVTGGIVALHGGRDFDEVQFDLATQGRRQPGSALKPVTAASALQQGMGLELRLHGNSPRTFPVEGAIEPFHVRNFGDASFGTVSLRRALVNSVNTAFADLVLRSGVEETIELAGRMGVNVERAFGDERTWGPAIVLGGLTHGVTPLEMASVFATFANDGINVRPHLISRVTDRRGNVLFEHEPQARRALDSGVAAAMVDLLTDVVEEGTGTRAQLEGLEVIGKTGTTSDSTDAWFIGAVPILSTSVWVGHPEAQVPMPGMQGGRLPAELWHAFMSQALDGVDVPEFVDDVADPERLPEPEPEEDEDEGRGPGGGTRVTPRPVPSIQPPSPPPPPPPPPPPSPRPSPTPAPVPTYSPPPAPAPAPTPPQPRRTPPSPAPPVDLTGA